MKKHVIFWTVAVLLAVMPAMAGAADKEKTDKKSGMHKEFMKEAAQGGIFEVKAGELASQRAQDPEVKQFADRMVSDHGKANNELQAIAQSKNISLPTEMGKKHEKHLAKLEKAKAKSFDREYMKLMVKDHEKDVAEFRKAKEKAQGNPELATWVEKTLPVLEEHLQMAQNIQKNLKAEKQNKEGEEGKE